ncbi:MAG: DNA methyltransferase [Byssovorax sp.]
MSKQTAGARSTFGDDLPGKLEVFVDTWKGFQGTEQAGAQEFLRGLLEIYEVETKPGTIFEQHPVRVKAKTKSAAQGSLFGSDDKPSYTTERMDMYLPKVCVWEMKAPSEKHLDKHHDQLLGYWARMRTRYMVLCNFHEFWVYDTDDDGGQLTPKLTFPLAELPARGDALLFLRGDKPDLEQRSERVTAEVAKMLGLLVRSLLQASPNPDADRDRISKFVLECVFAMFAEDTELVPPLMFTEVMRQAVAEGKMDAVFSLFDDFGKKNASERAHRFAPYVNGPLFDRRHPKLALTQTQIEEIHRAAKDFDWQGVRPEIFGSIFEQALDAAERHELGAHFTREEDIAKVVGPTVIEPWRRRIEGIRTRQDAERVVEQMKGFHVLDPACGCGNFLYVVYREMKRLESALVAKWTRVQRHTAKRASDVRPPPARPYFTLDQVHGIEMNNFAAFLARVVLWIGEHLAARELGLDDDTLPLKNLDETVRQGDALLIDWPRPEGELAVVGNPPYLGVRKMRRELGDAYVEEIFEKFPENRAADYVTYWFTKALGVLREGERAGFVCTNSVAQNESREASIDKIVEKGGTITDAWKSYPWPGEAKVHISIVNWAMESYDGIKTLDGQEVSSISPGLAPTLDLTGALRIGENERLCFMGVTPGNIEFVLTDEERSDIIGKDPQSSKVILPYLIGRDVNREVEQRPTRWIIDFGTMTKEDAEGYAGAMQHVRRYVYPVRKNNRREIYAERWWRFVEARPGLREAIRSHKHVLVMPCVTSHLIVSRQAADICFDHKLMVVALDDFYHFGVLQSSFHSAWAWARGSTLKADLSYTNTTVFETFPFPLLPGGGYDPKKRPEGDKADRVAAAAKAFDTLRSATCKEKNLGLTKIHNALEAGELPALSQAYEAMNDAVAACYGFPAGVWRDEKETLRLLLQLNQKIASPIGIAR